MLLHIRKKFKVVKRFNELGGIGDSAPGTIVVYNILFY